MNPRKMKWSRVAESTPEIAWQNNNMCMVEVAGKKLTLARFNGRIFAFSRKCPHASGIMADGFIDAMGHVVCPMHRYRFDMQNGRNTSGEGYYLKTYPVEQREDGIYIGREDRGFGG